jgi:hypothetical protein
LDLSDFVIRAFGLMVRKDEIAVHCNLRREERMLVLMREEAVSNLLLV